MNKISLVFLLLLGCEAHTQDMIFDNNRKVPDSIKPHVERGCMLPITMDGQKTYLTWCSEEYIWGGCKSESFKKVHPQYNCLDTTPAKFVGASRLHYDIFYAVDNDRNSGVIDYRDGFYGIKIDGVLYEALDITSLSYDHRGTVVGCTKLNSSGGSSTHFFTVAEYIAKKRRVMNLESAKITDSTDRLEYDGTHYYLTLNFATRLKTDIVDVFYSRETKDAIVARRIYAALPSRDELVTAKTISQIHYQPLQEYVRLMELLEKLKELSKEP